MHITVFEYGYITLAKEAESLGASRITSRAFNYLKEVSLSAEESDLCKCLSLTKRNGVELIQVKNYVGVLFTPTGEHIEVLPKVGRKAKSEDSAIEHSRQMLLMMLAHLGSFRYISANQASVANKKMPLLEVFIYQFLQSVNKLIKRGLKSDYVTQQDNLNFQKGKLLVGHQLKHNLVNRHKFYVQYDEYLVNRPANRLIATALQKVAQYTRISSNQKLLRELQFAFIDVPSSKSVAQDINAVRLDRGMSDYHAPLDWAKLILAGFSPLSMKGESNALSLLFPMEAVFESYVASILRKQLDGKAELLTQARSKYLVTHNEQNKFQLKPDLLIKKTNKPFIVLDTKWKLIDVTKHNYGISQSDMYQMFAYGHKYLGGEGELYLIYPSHEDFREPIEHSLDFASGLKLWVVPFVISLTDESRVKWPKTAEIRSL
ncbi:mcrBC 5-methylcytosine restriction system component family protein [Vibrio inusitatus NBRC 102082]|uniref:McrBC 5-methylcytosine restriction system component family protein n=1 Tax=Vibrio inusitatus NBRC 102082 TaxID=1219070 RepID=A0A4Y3HWN7_9VIBR|nr:McrC family protein [Vibrio inusitatus]GEA51435.1 mcrBC 5-methylcytosine restriction system component family protein [Vibrio inusitatus NBRC 102082]